MATRFRTKRQAAAVFLGIYEILDESEEDTRFKKPISLWMFGLHFRKLHSQLPDQKKSVAGFSSLRLRERDFGGQGGQTISPSSNIIQLF